MGEMLQCAEIYENDAQPQYSAAEQQALAEEYITTHYGVIIRAARRVAAANTYYDAGDVAQEVALKVLRNPQYVRRNAAGDATTNVTSTLATNYVIDQSRAQWYKRSRAYDMTTLPTDVEPQQLDDLNAIENRLVYKELLSYLTKEEQELVRDYYESEMTLQDIGKKHNVVKSTVRTWLVNIHAKLRNKLEHRDVTFADIA
jgi:RNA polymerase sigma factor (sigma-70 family)